MSKILDRKRDRKTGEQGECDRKTAAQGEGDRETGEQGGRGIWKQEERRQRLDSGKGYLEIKSQCTFE